MRKAGSLSWQLLFLCGLVFRPKSRQQFLSRSSSSDEDDARHRMPTAMATFLGNG